MSFNPFHFCDIRAVMPTASSRGLEKSLTVQQFTYKRCESPREASEVVWRVEPGETCLGQLFHGD